MVLSSHRKQLSAGCLAILGVLLQKLPSTPAQVLWSRSQSGSTGMFVGAGGEPWAAAGLRFALGTTL